ncbi:hypothetical protein ABL78_4593 [Leptomonas seymouri]|uniref:Uncharacterized protein n=1 Tax=Leptomonas seymouri TaxID=5684 RepID=A0A0N0P5T6_LEPSE|nr:hypothetical protein ABL78_4593 [Leptomonas seymouri]|eukprot:KPI86367.1 hypothetical protein ABL78_4593 [Leptomonas seymouri]
MRLSHNPIVLFAEESAAGDESSSSARQRRSPATAGISTAALAARVTAEPLHRITCASSVAGDTATAVSPDANGSTTKDESPTSSESLTASRHTDVQSNADVGATRATTSATVLLNATFTAMAPSSHMPASASGRSGLTSQYRSYQPSSLFGGNTALAPSASLSSWQMLAGTAANKRMASTVTSDYNSSASAQLGDSDPDAEMKASIAACYRPLDVTARPANGRGSMGSFSQHEPVALDHVSALTTQQAAEKGEVAGSKFSVSEQSAGQRTSGADLNVAKPEAGEEGELLPLIASDAATPVAVPASVQAVLKNPLATKEELWTALRTACQQCELLQSYLETPDVRPTAEDEAASKTQAAVTAAAAAAACSSPSLQNLNDAANNSNESSCPPAEKQGIRCSGNAERIRELDHGRLTHLSGAPRRVSTDSKEGCGLPTEIPRESEGAKTAATTSAHSNGSMQASSPNKSVEKRKAQGAASTASTDAIVPSLSTSALLRGRAKFGSTAASANSPATGSAGVSAALRSCVAEEIRRMETTLKGQRQQQQQKQKQKPKQKQHSASLEVPPARQVESERGEGTEAEGKAPSLAASSILINHRRDTGYRTNIIIKAPDDAIPGSPKMREAREMERRPSLTSAQSLPRDPRRPHHTDDAEGSVRESKGGSDDTEEQERADNACRQRRHHNGSGAGGGRERAELRRHASSTSDSTSVKSGNGFAMPSILSAHSDSLWKSSFMSHSHDSNRTPLPHPPSPLANESIVAPGRACSPPSPPHSYHRRRHGASCASAESVDNGPEDSVSSNERGGGQTEGTDSLIALVLPTSAHCSIAPTTLPALKDEDAPTGPRSMRPSHPLGTAEKEDHRGKQRGSRDASRTGAVQQSSWLTRSGSPASPSNSGLPSIHSPPSSSQKSILSQCPSPCSGRGGGAWASSSATVEPIHARTAKLHPSGAQEARTPPGSANRNADGRVLSLLPQAQETVTPATLGSASCAHSHANSSTAASSLMEMMRQMADEDMPVSSSCDGKKAELREWRRQAAKMGLRGAPSTC